jgi:4-hydroxy-3-methylbut-2-en-1-yl diphosphate reductase
VEKCRASGRRAIHIERPEELDSKDFANVAIVGLTAGTSTMLETVEAVFKRLQEFSSARSTHSNQKTSS